jgi:hypothetical protein
VCTILKPVSVGGWTKIWIATGSAWAKFGPDRPILVWTKQNRTPAELEKCNRYIQLYSDVPMINMMYM